MKHLNPIHAIKKSLFVFFLFAMVITIAIKSEKLIAAEDPIIMLKGATERLMDVLRKNKETLKSNPGRIYSIVNEYVLPYTDFEEMSKWVVGRNAWNEASLETRNQFIKEFKTMVVNAYAKSLLAYSDQTIEFLPERQNSQGRVQVSSVIRGGERGPLRIDYRMIQAGNSWKVYDIIIEGVSLMQGYRSQFSEDVSGGGMDAVVEKLQQHNARKAQG